ncbi:MAG TPA: hypothetical protein DCK87_02780 [Desulfotomaculum sp.]|nr:hypothetical protein [Desulfotomaculum sp.]
MKISLFLTPIFGIIFQLLYWPCLPEKVATHFSANGFPNGWEPKESNFIFTSAILVFIAIVFLLTPFLLKKCPKEWINFPKKDYWLAPERKESSILIISNWMYFIGLATNILLIIIFHLVYIANTTNPVKLNNNLFFPVLIIYLLISIGWGIMLHIRFNKTT